MKLNKHRTLVWVVIMGISMGIAGYVLKIRYDKEHTMQITEGLLSTYRWTSTQGTSVVFVPTQNPPLLDITVSIDAGSARDETQAGLAALVVAMFDEGTLHTSGQQLAEKLDALGALFGAEVNRDRAMLSLRTLNDPEILPEAIDWLAEVLAYPAFAAEAFSRIQAEKTVLLKHQQQQPHEVA
jgi:zinc protease